MSVLAGILGETASWVQVVIGVGLLIFIHEGGHFLVAKWKGVKVLAFSLGFGPVLWSFRRGDTDYRLSLVPLGGYVKMSGETERPEGGYAPDDYPAKPLGARALIIFAGVAMNALLALVLFAAALLAGVPLLPPRIGGVVPGSPAWRAGIREGDRVLRSDGRDLLEFGDLQHEALRGEPLRLEVDRAGRRLEIVVTPVQDANRGAPVLGVGPGGADDSLVIEPGSPAEAAGFRTGDLIVAVDGVPCTLDRLYSDPLSHSLFFPPSGPLRITLARGGGEAVVSLPPIGTRPRIGLTPFRGEIEAVRPGGPAAEAGVEPGDRPRAVGGTPVSGEVSFRAAVLRAPPGPVEVRVARGESGERTYRAPADAPGRREFLADLLFRSDPAPGRVEVMAGGPRDPSGNASPSPAAAAGLRSGDRILAFAGSPLAGFADIPARVEKAAGKPIPVTWESEAEGRREGHLAPAAFAVFGEAGALLTFPEGLSGQDSREVVRAGSAGELFALTGERFTTTLRGVGSTLSGILTTRVSAKNLGGPILIGQMARGSVQSGLPSFLWLLAILSVNLAVFNLLPIPVLDGGQLALLGVEAVTRRKPSETVVALAQWAGLVVLLGLVGLVFYNDIARLVGAG